MFAKLNGINIKFKYSVPGESLKNMYFHLSKVYPGKVKCKPYFLLFVSLSSRFHRTCKPHVNTVIYVMCQENYVYFILVAIPRFTTWRNSVVTSMLESYGRSRN